MTKVSPKESATLYKVGTKIKRQKIINKRFMVG